MNRTRTIENNEMSLYKQVSGSIYGLLDHEKRENYNLPINPNNLFFKDRTLNTKFTESLFKDMTSIGPSLEFKHNLKLFYIFHISFILITLVTTILHYTYDNQTYSHLVLRLTLLCFIFILSILCAFLVLKFPSLLIRSQRIFLSLSAFLIFYLIVSDERILSGITNQPYSNSFQGFYVSMLRHLLLNSFYYLVLICVPSLILTLVFLMVFSNVSILNGLADFFILGVFLVLELMETHQTDYRTRQLFWRKQMEEEYLDNFELASEGANTTAASISTEIELVIQSCDKIKMNLKAATAVIMYKDVKRKLKSAQSDLERVKRRLAQGTLTNITKLDHYSGLSEDEKKYIIQNFTNVVETGIRKNHPISAKLSTIHIWTDYSAEIENLMAAVGSVWNLDIWFIYNSTGQSIPLIGKYLFDKWQLTATLQTSQTVISNFFVTLENAYHNNPYHNACHGSDVLHNILYFFTNSHIISSLTSLELLSAIIAGLGHDVSHPAFTNKFLIATKDELALTYNDKSVLENMHISKIYSILNKDSCNIFTNLNENDWVTCRKIIIEMILETDMSKHFETLGKFRTRTSSIGDIDLDKSEDKLFVMCMAIKCADIGHSAKVTELHEKWTLLVSEEFFHQGDVEKEHNLPVSIYCDRETTDLPRSQAGFIKNICMPLYEAWGNYLKSDAVYKNCCEQLKINLKTWENKIKTKE